MSDPFFITGPALISFSGGRTSAYMLWRILQAHGGTLPDDVLVAFENTGKERVETLRFVHECGSRWGVHIHWLEWREGQPGFEEVDFNSASRDGAPFMRLIEKRSYTPNSVTRFCSAALKILTAKKFAQRQLGWTHWVNIIGLRYDEGHRVLKALARNEANKEPFKAAMPLSTARVTKRDVLEFWLGPSRHIAAGNRPQGFDLGLKDYEGNCDLCFLKARAKKLAIIRENPGSVDWWIAAEEAAKQKTTGAGGLFVTEYSYADLARQVAEQPHMFDDLADDAEQDVECGLWCGDETA